MYVACRWKRKRAKNNILIIRFVVCKGLRTQLGDFWTPWLQSQDQCQRSPVLQLPALEGDSWFWLVDIIVHSLLIGCYISILISDWYNIKRSLIGWYNLILISDWLKVGCWPGGSWILETQRWHHQLQSLQQEVWLHRQDSSLQSLWRGVLLSLLKYVQSNSFVEIFFNQIFYCLDYQRPVPDRGWGYQAVRVCKHCYSVTNNGVLEPAGPNLEPNEVQVRETMRILASDWLIHNNTSFWLVDT